MYDFSETKMNDMSNLHFDSSFEIDKPFTIDNSPFTICNRFVGFVLF